MSIAQQIKASQALNNGSVGGRSLATHLLTNGGTGTEFIRSQTMKGVSGGGSAVVGTMTASVGSNNNKIPH